MGSSRGGPSRRDVKSVNHTLPGHRGAMRSSRTQSRRTLSRTPGSRAIGGKAYRRSLGHICTIMSSPRGPGMLEGESERTVRRLSRRKQIHLCLERTPSISSPPPRGGAFIPRASAPVSTGCSPIFLVPGTTRQQETTTSLGTTGGFGTPVFKVDVTATPPGDLCRRPPMCYLSGQAHGGP